MLTQTGVKLLDFGLARLRPAASRRVARGALEHRRSPSRAHRRHVASTWRPSSSTASEADARTDIFAFGAVLYEMLTGTRAFAADSQAGVDRSDPRARSAAAHVRQPLFRRHWNASSRPAWRRIRTIAGSVPATCCGS